MISRVRRAIFAAVIGALNAALCLIAAYTLHPGLYFEMDRPLPSFIQGISHNERDGRTTFAWTSGHVVADIPGLDRQVGWSCTIRFRGARAEGMPQPTLALVVDGRPASPVAATNDYQDLGVVLPPAATNGASIVIDVSPTFKPGGGDTRTLGIQIDRFICRPASVIVRPPANALAYASLAAGIFAAGLALLGLSLSSAMFAAAVIGLGQTVMMAMSSGMYGTYPGKLPWLALAVVVSTLVLAQAIELWRRESLSSSARFVMAASASVLFLKLAGLYHPGKPIVDAMLNSHRLDAVLAGHRFFTQDLGNGVLMPYAIGLYVFTAPWAWLTADHIALVRTVTAGADVIAGALLYPVMLRAWGDRRAAALAAVLFQLVPLPFTTLGNGNLPNMFGQSMALAAMSVVVTWRLDLKRIGSLLAFTVLTAWALCTHISTVTIFGATLGVLVVLYFWRGDASRKRAAIAIAVASAVALAFAWFAYYGHFVEVFRDAFALMFNPPAAEASTAGVKGYMTMAERVWDLAKQAIWSAGWPLLLLSCAGVWSLARRRTRDDLRLALIAWAIVWVGLSASTVFSRVDPAHVRYSAEFLGRINLATVPLVAILAARGAASGWEPDAPASIRRTLQVVAAILIAWTLVIAVQAWIGWLQR